MGFYHIPIVLSCLVYLASVASLNVTCFYDTFSINRQGTANFTTKDLESALPYCNFIVYGYVGLNSQTFEVSTSHAHQRQQFALVPALKRKYPKTKFLLSFGGVNHYNSTHNIYTLLTQASAQQQQRFTRSISRFVGRYKFHGLDLALQAPNAYAHHQRSERIPRPLPKYLQRLTQLVRGLKESLQKYQQMLTWTVLPNENPFPYFDMPAIISSLDFITICAFDLSQPRYTPRAANYLAPLYSGANSASFSVAYMLERWLEIAPAQKIFLGLPSYGRSWNTTKALKKPKMPITTSLNGPAPGGPYTKTPGLLAWYEICKKLSKISAVMQPKLGTFAYRPGLKKGQHGLLITLDRPKDAEKKVTFAKRQQLGGVSLFEISLDDYRGRCRGRKYEFLQAIKRAAT